MNFAAAFHGRHSRQKIHFSLIINEEIFCSSCQIQCTCLHKPATKYLLTKYVLSVVQGLMSSVRCMSCGPVSCRKSSLRFSVFFYIYRVEA